jgi:ureidoglycolate lyase
MEMTVCRYLRQPMVFTSLERHLAVTQAFLPLGGVACAMVVAPPTEGTERDAAPPPESLRAFRMDGGQGVVLWRGTWHALRRFPIGAPHVDVVLLTGAATQAEIERQARDGILPALTHEFDYGKRHGVEFHVAVAD